MANKLIREKKDTVIFSQTLDNSVYKSFFAHCRKKGVKVQDRIRFLVGEDLNKTEL